MSDFLNEMFGDSYSNDFGSGMFSQPKSRFSSRNEEHIPEKILPCTLEELYNGCQKNLRVRDVLRMHGMNFPIERTFTIDVSPGWTNGTKLIFNPTQQYPKSIIFIISEQKHRYFERKGDDLIWKCKLTSKQVKSGVMIKLPLLDGSILQFDTKDLDIHTKSQKLFKGLGMPKTSTRGGGKGDLIVNFEVTSL